MGMHSCSRMISVATIVHLRIHFGVLHSSYQIRSEWDCFEMFSLGSPNAECKLYKFLMIDVN